MIEMNFIRPHHRIGEYVGGNRSDSYSKDPEQRGDNSMLMVLTSRFSNPADIGNFGPTINSSFSAGMIL